MKWWEYTLILFVIVLIILIGVFICKDESTTEAFQMGDFQPVSTVPPSDITQLAKLESTVFDAITPDPVTNYISGTYTVFDPTLAYLQKDLLLAQYAKEKNMIIASENYFISLLLPANCGGLLGCPPVVDTVVDNMLSTKFNRTYIDQWYRLNHTFQRMSEGDAESNSPLYTNTDKAYMFPELMTLEQFKNFIITNVNNTYSKLMTLLNGHPIGYIASGYDNEIGLLNAYPIWPTTAPNGSWMIYRAQRWGVANRLATRTPSPTWKRKRCIYGSKMSVFNASQYDVDRLNINSNTGVFNLLISSFLNDFLAGGTGVVSSDFNCCWNKVWGGNTDAPGWERQNGSICPYPHTTRTWRFDAWPDWEYPLEYHGWGRPDGDAGFCYIAYPNHRTPLSEKGDKGTPEVGPLQHIYNKNILNKNILISPNTWKPIYRPYITETSFAINTYKDPTIQINLNPNVDTIDSPLKTFMDKKGFQRNKYMFRPVKINGFMTQTNRDEINKSIAYSMYFNFSDNSLTERQIRVSSNLKVYMSPDISGMPQFSTKLIKVDSGGGSSAQTGNTTQNSRLVTLQDEIANANNSIHMAIEVTPEMLKYIPYHGREYIRKWAANRIQRVSTFDGLNRSTIAAHITLDLAAKFLATTVSPWKAKDTENYVEKTLAPANANPDWYVSQPYMAAYLRHVYALGDAAKVLASGWKDPGTVVVPDFAPILPTFDLMSPSITADVVGHANYNTCVQSTIKAGVADTICDAIKPVKSTGLDISGKQIILEKIAQTHYNYSGGSKRMLRIYDVYQIGDTIYDVRYSELSKTSQQFKDAINTITNEYYKLRDYPLSPEEFSNLEIKFQQKIAQYYIQEEANVIGGTISNCGTSARYIRVQASTLTSTIYLSQVLAINNAGTNVLSGAGVTVANSTMVHLFPGDNSPSTLTDYNGNVIPLETPAFLARQTYLNDIIKRGKMLLLTDGNYKSRAEPTVYKSNLSTSTIFTVGSDPQNTDFIDFDLGDEREINVVKIIYPSNNPAPADAASVYKITLYDRNHLQIGDSVVTSVLSHNKISSIVSFLKPPNTMEDSGLCPKDLVNLYKTSRFYAKIDSAQNTALTVDPKNITFIGFSEDEGLSFNEMYNCGFSLDLNSQYGNMNYLVTKLVYNLNEPQLPQINCTDPEQLKRLLLEYRLSHGTPTFQQSFSDLTGNAAYDFTNAYYYPSSITSYAQIENYSCGIAWNELKVDKITNQTLDAPIQRYAKFVMSPDTENWWSQRLNFNMSSSEIYMTNALYNAGNNPQMTQLQTPIRVPLPQAPKATLTNGNGACPDKTCSDIDVITPIMDAYNSQTDNNIKILRVNKAVTPYSNLCEFEVVAADYKTGTPITSVSSIAMFVDIDITTCTYKLISTTQDIGIETMTLGSGFFINNDTPLLSKIYTYAQQTIKPYMNSFTSIINTLTGLGNTQLDPSKQSITSSLLTYRSNTLAAYGTINILDGCESTYRPRCSDPTILNSFFNTYNINGNTGKYISTIQYAGTASGTECDFTFTAQDLTIDATTGIKRTNPQTMGYRCRVAKLPGIGCQFGMSTGTYKSEEAYHVYSATNYSRSQSYNVCNDKGGRVATFNELVHASTMGAAWTNPGWVNDMSGAFVFINGSVSSATLTSALDPKYGVTCIGIKPPEGTAGISPFNTTNYSMPIVTMGPCMEILARQPPVDQTTIDNLADTGMRATTASPLADSDSYKLTTTSADIFPYSIRNNIVSPLDYIDCSSKYAIKSMQVYPVYGVGNLNQSTCVISTTNNTFRPFSFTRLNGIYTASGPGTSGASNPTMKTVNIATEPSLTLTTAIANSAACMTPQYLNVTGMSGLIKRANKINDNTCEYRVTDRDDLPFSDTYKMISFYNETTTTISIGSITPSTPPISTYIFSPSINTIIQTPNGQNASTLIGLFKSTFNGIFSKITPTNTNPQQKVGKVTSIGYSPSEDALIIVAKYVTIGPNDLYDIRTYISSNIFRVIFRNNYLDNTKINIYQIINNVNTMVSDVGTMYPVTNDADDPVVDDPATVWLQRPLPSGSLANAINDESNKWLFLRFTVTDISLDYYEIFRLNFYTFSGVGLTLISPISYSCNSLNNLNISEADTTKASVYLTDINVNKDTLLVNNYLNISNAPCRQYYKPSRDRNNVPICVLDLTQSIPNKNLYSYTRPSASAPCAMGYTLEGNQCVLNNNFQDLIQNYCNSGPSSATPRLRLYKGQSVVINLGGFQYIHAYNLVSGASGREPTRWTVEGSLNGAQWVQLHSQSSPYSYPSRTPSQFIETPLFTMVQNKKPSWPTPPTTIPADAIISVPVAAVEGFHVPIPEQHFTKPAVRPNVPMREPLYRNPLQITPDHVTARRRITTLRFKTLETMDPASRYVTMSMFRLYSATNQLPVKGFKFSNLEGSRRLAAEGPEALLADTPSQRWVDYNKSPLLIRIDGVIDMPEVVGYRFFIPTVENSRGALPVRWRIEGSYDGRIWETIHDMSREKALYRSDSTTVYKFSTVI
jgi:hypothetical protein